MFLLSQQSIKKLQGVEPRLVAVVNAAITQTTQDFCVTEGLRSTGEEAKHVANGTSHTMNSMHLVQPDGFSHAVDLVPVVDGSLIWSLPATVQWKFIYPVAEAMRACAAAAGVRLRWGGAWDRCLNDLAPSAEKLKADVVTYCARHVGPDFLDGPHYELIPGQ